MRKHITHNRHYPHFRSMMYLPRLAVTSAEFLIDQLINVNDQAVKCAYPTMQQNLVAWIFTTNELIWTHIDGSQCLLSPSLYG